MTNQARSLSKSTNVRAGVSRRTLRRLRRAMHVTERLSPQAAARVAELIFTSPRRFERPASEWEMVVCAQVEQLELVPDDGRKGASTRFSVFRWGDPEAPTVALVHGWQGRGTQLHAFIDPLLERGLSVIAVDVPAHGSSPGHSTSLLEVVRCLGLLGERVGPLRGVIAHSFGAAATTLALDEGLEAERVVFLAPFVAIDAGLDRFGDLLELGPEVRRLFRQRMEARGARAIEDVEPVTLARGRSEALLVVHDPSDRDTPIAESEALVRAWPGAELVTFGGLGHFRVLKDPRVVGLATDFLSGSGRFEVAGRPPLRPRSRTGFEGLYYR